jgi:hypothetical protein
MATATIEHHPENGPASHVVVVAAALDGRQRRIWFAYRTAKQAEIKRLEIEKRFTDQGL